MPDAEPAVPAVPATPRSSRWRSLGVVALLGFAAGGLAAIAGNQAWVSVDGDGPSIGSAASQLSTLGDASAPPVTAMALVLLASWGVVLVTRGRVRRAVSWLGLLAAVATVGFAVAAWIVAPDQVRTEVLPALGLTDRPISHTLWSYVGVLASLVGVLASVQAVRSVAGWPEMGRRYDAPGGDDSPAPAVPIEDQTNLDLWRAIDEGHDPTAEHNH